MMPGLSTSGSSLPKIRSFDNTGCDSSFTSCTLPERAAATRGGSGMERGGRDSNFYHHHIDACRAQRPSYFLCCTERSHVVNSIFAASASFSPAAWWSRCLLHLSVRTPKSKAWLCSSPAGCKANSNDCANRSRLCICVCNAGALMPSEASTKCCKKALPSSKIWTTELRYHNRTGPAPECAPSVFCRASTAKIGFGGTYGSLCICRPPRHQI